MALTPRNGPEREGQLPGELQSHAECLPPPASQDTTDGHHQAGEKLLLH